MGGENPTNNNKINSTAKMESNDIVIEENSDNIQVLTNNKIDSNADVSINGVHIKSSKLSTNQKISVLDGNKIGSGSKIRIGNINVG